MANEKNAMPCEGGKAPLFTLPAHSGGKVKLSELKGKPVVLYFYPRDDTPGCTLEAHGFRDTLDDLQELGVEVLGVSPDGVESHCAFVEKHALNFTLLSDEGHRVAEKYGVWVEKNQFGKKRWGIQRATFLIGPTGTIARVWPRVKPRGHAESVLAAVRAL